MTHLLFFFYIYLFLFSSNINQITKKEKEKYHTSYSNTNIQTFDISHIFFHICIFTVISYIQINVIYLFSKHWDQSIHGYIYIFLYIHKNVLHNINERGLTTKEKI